ncbi:MAG: trypsin-like peptidase domain-containing protein [Paracoccus sp. (in: a-proteobacteria)]
MNADITVAGYPLSGILSGLNITRGAVSSLKGVGGDAISMQISAPVQPGNSGGPAVDGEGRVVGVVVSKLNATQIAQTTGDIPQNVNFAIRGEMARLFMFQNGVEPVIAEEGAPALDPVTLGKKLEAVTRLVECYRGAI